jgi:hypothetical protein
MLYQVHLATNRVYEDFMEKYISVLARRAAKWETLVENKT